MKIALPPGHHWEEQDSSASEVVFVCEVCGATFAHDLVDDSVTFDNGDGSCDGGEE